MQNGSKDSVTSGNHSRCGGAHLQSQHLGRRRRKSGMVILNYTVTS